MNCCRSVLKYGLPFSLACWFLMALAWAGDVLNQPGHRPLPKSHRCIVPGSMLKDYGIANPSGLLGIFDFANDTNTSSTKNATFSTNALKLYQGTADNQSTAVNDPYKVEDFDGSNDFLPQEIIDDQTGMTLLPTAATFDLTATGAAMQLPDASLATASGNRRYTAVWKDATPKIIAYGYIGEADAAESLGAELVVSGDAESGGVTGWSSESSSGVTISILSPYSGTSHWRVNSNNVGNNFSAKSFSGLTAGNIYKISCYSKLVGGASYSVKIYGTLWTSLKTSETFTNAEYTQTVLYFVATTTTAYVGFGGPTNAVIYVDDISVTPVTNLGTSAAHIYTTLSGVTRGWTYKDATAAVNSPTALEVYRSDFNLLGNQTHILLVKPDDGQPAAIQYLAGRMSGTSGRYSGALRIATDGKLAFAHSADGSTLLAPATTAAVFTNGAQEKYKLVAAVHDSPATAFYVDGLRVASSGVFSATLFDTPDALMVGARDSITPGLHFSGRIALYIVFNRALSASEIAAIANSCTVQKRLR